MHLALSTPEQWRGDEVTLAGTAEADMRHALMRTVTLVPIGE